MQRREESERVVGTNYSNKFAARKIRALEVALEDTKIVSFSQKIPLLISNNVNLEQNDANILLHRQKIEALEAALWDTKMVSPNIYTILVNGILYQMLRSSFSK